MHLKKPSWLKAKTWGEFCSKYQREDGSFPCSQPGCLRKADTVDHIKPRSHPDFTELREYIDEDDRKRKQSNPDAAHVLENLQPMCRSHNSSKGVRPDAYWSNDLYFDCPLDLDKLRASQRDYIYTAMREAGPLMVGRLNQINGKLLSFFQVTGAGKTLGKFVLPFAINHGLIDASDMHRPARVDRVLIVVKDQALRGQLVRELGGDANTKAEPVDLEIINQAPVVKEATSSSDLVTYSKMPGVHFVICCTQALWDKDDSAITDANRQQLFNAFPAIIFDEMHFAIDRIRQVVHQATNSLVFGLTASPIDGGGMPLEDMVCVSTYGYQQACANDNSMKSLGEAVDDPRGTGLSPVFDDLIEEVLPSEVENLDNVTVLRGVEGQGCYSLASAINVANALIERIDRLDRLRLSGVASGHRRLHSPDIERVVASLKYPSHAILRCHDILTAEFLTNHINAKLSANPDLYPPKLGWKAAVAHSNGKQLDEDTHPWFWSKNNGGKLSADAARILVVKDMACEGINNRFCNTVAWAHIPGTKRRLVQADGRAARAVVKKDGSTLNVPHAHLDRIYILTHFNWGRGAEKSERQKALIESLRFFYNPDSLDGLISFQDWLEHGEEIHNVDLAEDNAGVGLYDLQKILSYLATCRRNGGRVSMRKVYEMVGCKGGKRQDAVREVTQGLATQDPKTVLKVQKRFGQLTEVSYLGPIATLEKIDPAMTTHDAVNYVTNIAGTDALLALQEEDPEGLATACQVLAPMLRGSYFKPQEVTMQQTVSDVLRQIGIRLIHNLQLFTHKDRIYKEVFRAARIMLGVGHDEVLGKDSRFNIWPVILMLQETRLQGKITGHVLRTLYDQGFIAEEGYLLGIKDLAAQQQQESNEDS